MNADLPLVRQWILLRSLCSRGCWLTVRELAEESGVSEKTLHPYSIKRHEGSLYVHGHEPDDGQLRTWKLDRIEQADADPMPFTIPADLDLEARFAGSLGIYDGQDDVRVKIRFAAEVARYVAEKQWHHSQQLTPQKDGSLIVELRLSNTVEVKSWVLSFGTNAGILEPESLRDEIREELERALSQYVEHTSQAATSSTHRGLPGRLPRT